MLNYTIDGSRPKFEFSAFGSESSSCSVTGVELFKDTSAGAHDYLELVESAGKYVVRPKTENDNLDEIEVGFYLRVNYNHAGSAGS